MDEAAGSRRKVCARRLGHPLSTFEKWCLPPASDEHPNGNGETNSLDRMVTLAYHAERPGVLFLFMIDYLLGCDKREAMRPELLAVAERLAKLLGYELRAKGEVQGRLVVRRADLAEATERLLAELRKRKPSPALLRSLRDEQRAVAERLVAQKGVE